VLKLLTNYLHKRIQYTVCKGDYSTNDEVLCEGSTPQGSTLGPLQFNYT